VVGSGIDDLEGPLPAIRSIVLANEGQDIVHNGRDDPTALVEAVIVLEALAELLSQAFLA